MDGRCTKVEYRNFDSILRIDILSGFRLINKVLELIVGIEVILFLGNILLGGIDGWEMY